MKYYEYSSETYKTSSYNRFTSASTQLLSCLVSRFCIGVSHSLYIIFFFLHSPLTMLFLLCAFSADWPDLFSSAKRTKPIEGKKISFSFARIVWLKYIKLYEELFAVKLFPLIELWRDIRRKELERTATDTNNVQVVQHQIDNNNNYCEREE